VSVKMIRWACPNGCPGVLGPSRPRRDDVRRYCLKCSEDSGRLVERVAPVIERRRQSAKERAKRKRALAPRKRVTTFGLNGAGRLEPVEWLWPWSSMPAPVDVRYSSKPRRPIIGDEEIIFYEYPEMDFHDMRAAVVVAGLRHHVRDRGDCVAARAHVRTNVETGLGVRPTLNGGIDDAQREVAALLRAKAACAELEKA
jgi:hypothetical protein